MPKTILISVILISILGSMFCSRNPNSFVRGDEVTIYFGQSVTFGPDKIKIKFDSLLIESRCPDNPLICCFWQGMAAIQLSLITQDGDTVRIVTAIEGLTQYPEEDSYPAVDTLGLSIELIKLDPYPRTEEIPPQSEYQAVLKIKPSIIDYHIDGHVLIIDADPIDLLRDNYAIDSAKIEDDILTLSVAYGGGCKTHYFFAYVHSFILKSNPPQMNLYLHHFGNDDLCEAYIHQKFRFDLTPLAEYYKGYDPDGGDLIIRLNEYWGDEPGMRDHITYSIR
ncbi:MAG: hypothetical protein DRP51_03175 [Candidatus Zixiibacteriota bacterium]|nr:MAG: hypothetical protein DRP51_03175 [candidate division Zixibacteria bacterium]HHI02245.1 hypothetical protein [candidate division Zixibacteria bacterium]